MENIIGFRCPRCSKNYSNNSDGCCLSPIEFIGINDIFKCECCGAIAKITFLKTTKGITQNNKSYKCFCYKHGYVSYECKSECVFNDEDSLMYGA
jgi:hypothetical protein